MPSQLPSGPDRPFRRSPSCATARRPVVVTAVKPSDVATYAVEELVSHVKKATGHQLPVAVETAIPDGYDSHIFVGVSDAARKQGIDADKLEIEHYVPAHGRQ